MKKFMLGLVVVSFLAVPGCFPGRLSPAAKKQIKEAAKTADERVKSFSLWSTRVKAKDPAEEEALQRLLKAHGEGLAHQAKGLDDLNKAVNTK